MGSVFEQLVVTEGEDGIPVFKTVISEPDQGHSKCGFFIRQ